MCPELHAISQDHILAATLSQNKLVNIIPILNKHRIQIIFAILLFTHLGGAAGSQ